MLRDRINELDYHIRALRGNLSHVKRVLRLSEMLAGKEGIAYNEDALILACYFHDIAAWPTMPPVPLSKHAQASAEYIPGLARQYGLSSELVPVIVEAVALHDVPDAGTHAETILLRNADGLDYLGYIAAARDIAKSPDDLQGALALLKTRKEQFYPIIDLPTAKAMSEPRLREMEAFENGLKAELYGF